MPAAIAKKLRDSCHAAERTELMKPAPVVVPAEQGGWIVKSPNRNHFGDDREVTVREPLHLYVSKSNAKAPLLGDLLVGKSRSARCCKDAGYVGRTGVAQ
jgi:hypothetical protein